MADGYGMIASYTIQILTRERPALGCLCVVVFEAEDPFARRRLGGALGDRRLDLGDGAQIAIHFAEMPQAGRRGMAVGVDKSRDHRLAAQIDALRTRRGQAADLLIRSGRKEPPAGDRYRFGVRIRRVHGMNISVPEDQLRLAGRSSREGAGAEGTEKIASLHNFSSVMSLSLVTSSC